ncbi:MAG: transglycosylase domain-containing protein [Geobacteraceae bacterium]|nr:transglycosylase domain-containing protein [Geobacteraceae bacterium]
MNMKKLLLMGMGMAALYAAYLGVSLLLLPSVDSLKDRKMNMTIRVKDWKGNFHPFTVGPKNRYWTPLPSIPPEMKWAVILAEDDRFYKHEGVDIKAIKYAIKYDLEKKSFARGASTITQQTAKNLFLSREKSINRKIKEVILAYRMEGALTKGRILELYLNVVELGPMVYGIGHGARYYFGKPASALTPRECAFLAAMLPGPRVAYNPYLNMGKVVRRSEMILKLLRRKGILSAGEYQAALGQAPDISGLQRKVDESIRKEEAFNNVSSAVAEDLPGSDGPEDGRLPEGEESRTPPPETIPADIPPQSPAEGSLPESVPPQGEKQQLTPPR